ncbi:MAG: manganese efflux pump [Synergistaceae bacterium]|nr:manganese efflux pump MntP family protein [Synergistota bacterium]NLM72290.1 manganese efflux pump [Synergistaceae bacterium]
MSPAETLLISLSLSMDAFAASLGIGACLDGGASTSALRVGAACGAFQFAMPLAGCAVGCRFLDYISGYDHWLAFLLLLLVGGNMMRASLSKRDESCPSNDSSTGLALLTIALATSIDALAVGIGFSAMGASVLLLSSSAGIITACLCFAGVMAGFRTGGLLGGKAEFAGGLVLCLVGANILRAHLAG